MKNCIERTYSNHIFKDVYLNKKFNILEKIKNILKEIGILKNKPTLRFCVICGLLEPDFNSHIGKIFNDINLKLIEFGCYNIYYSYLLNSPDSIVINADMNIKDSLKLDLIKSSMEKEFDLERNHALLNIAIIA